MRFFPFLGASHAARAIAHGNHKVHIECSVQGDNLELHVHGMIRDFVLKVKLDQETEIKTPDGRHIKVCIHIFQSSRKQDVFIQ